MKKMIFMITVMALSVVMVHAAKMDTITVEELNSMLSKDSVVDLGLSVKWANINVGAKAPYEHGNYFAWGEVEPKDHYDEKNSLTYGKNTAELKEIKVLDKNSELTAEYDAATRNWGGQYRMPNSEEVDELFANATSSQKAVKLKDGTLVFGVLYTSKKNQQSIFLTYPGTYATKGYKPYDGKPMTNPGTYWTRTSHPMGAADMAVYFMFGRFGAYRHYGLPVRPVMEKPISDDVENLWDEFVVKATVLEKKLGKETWVDMGTGVKWMNRNLGAKKVYEYGDFYRWGEVNPKGSSTQGECLFCGKEAAALLKNKMVREDSSFNRYGSVEMVYNLLPKYDAATKKLGKKFRIPTDDQLDESIFSYCDAKRIIVVLPNGERMKGMLFRSKKNGNMVFFPAAGVRYEGASHFESLRVVLWTSSLRGKFAKCWANGEMVSLKPDYEVPIRPIMVK